MSLQRSCQGLVSCFRTLAKYHMTFLNMSHQFSFYTLVTHKFVLYSEVCLDSQMDIFMLLFSVFQGEVGPAGKSGFEGGLGLVGSAGPRGLTVHGKEVGRCLLLQYITMIN